jgi:hypothetical protein
MECKQIYCIKSDYSCEIFSDCKASSFYCWDSEDCPKGPKHVKALALSIGPNWERFHLGMETDCILRKLISTFLWYDMDRTENDVSNNSS